MFFFKQSFLSPRKTFWGEGLKSKSDSFTVALEKEELYQKIALNLPVDCDSMKYEKDTVLLHDPLPDEVIALTWAE